MRAWFRMVGGKFKYLSSLERRESHFSYIVKNYLYINGLVHILKENCLEMHYFRSFIPSLSLLILYLRIYIVHLDQSLFPPNPSTWASIVPLISRSPQSLHIPNPTISTPASRPQRSRQPSHSPRRPQSSPLVRDLPDGRRPRIGPGSGIPQYASGYARPGWRIMH